MTKTIFVGVRMTPAERRKIEQLADQAGVTPSEVLRALVRGAVAVRPVEALVIPVDVGADHAAASVQA